MEKINKHKKDKELYIIVLIYLKEYMRKYKENRAKKIKEREKENKKRIKKRQKKYYQEHKQQISKYNKKWRKRNKEKIKKYREDNKIYLAKYAKKYNKNRRHTDINFKISANLRKRIWALLKGKNKSAKTMELLGCTILELRKHLENQFKKDMTWKNYGKWHIDHIKPCCRFDLSKAKEQQKCFHYTNLRPLWAKDNLTRPKLIRGKYQKKMGKV